MEKVLCKITEEYRIETEAEVDVFDREVRQEAEQGHYDITGFARAHKITKDDDFYLVKVTRTFNKPTDPMLDFNGVEFTKVAY